ncbi:MAG: GIY-YIG nuclease family protein [Planctomycetota bacterium]
MSRLAYRIAGGSKFYYAMDEECRQIVRGRAHAMFALGADIGRAHEGERRRRDGFLYVISHPLMRGVKIGRAFNPRERLAQYQTACPERAYHLAYEGPYFEDCESTERRVHQALNGFRLRGEWFAVSVDLAVEVIKSQSPFVAAA